MKIIRNSHFRCHDRKLGSKRKFAQGNTIDTTRPSIDSFWPNLGRKIAPKSIQHTDSEISWFFSSFFYTFLTTVFAPFSLCTCITLRAKKALRIIIQISLLPILLFKRRKAFRVICTCSRITLEATGCTSHIDGIPASEFSPDVRVNLFALIKIH